MKLVVFENSSFIVKSDGRFQLMTCFAENTFQNTHANICVNNVDKFCRLDDFITSFDQQSVELRELRGRVERLEKQPEVEFERLKNLKDKIRSNGAYCGN